MKATSFISRWMVSMIFGRANKSVNIPFPTKGVFRIRRCKNVEGGRRDNTKSIRLLDLRGRGGEGGGEITADFFFASI